MADNLVLGDVVQLKSGGPRMTVESPQDRYGYDSYESVKCVWFNGATRMEQIFAVASLKKIEN